MHDILQISFSSVDCKLNFSLRLEAVQMINQRINRRYFLADRLQIALRAVIAIDCIMILCLLKFPQTFLQALLIHFIAEMKHILHRQHFIPPLSALYHNCVNICRHKFWQNREICLTKRVRSVKINILNKVSTVNGRVRLLRGIKRDFHKVRENFPP